MAFVRKRDNGSWYVFWREAGRQHARSFGSDRRGAEAYKKELDRLDAAGKQPPTMVPIREFYARWWREDVERRLRAKTKASYRGYAERNILPYLGTKKLASLGKTDVSAWIERLNAHGVAPSSIKESFVVLRSMLRYAVDLDLIPSNPCEGMARYLPEQRPKRRRPHLEPQQVVALAKASYDGGGSTGFLRSYNDRIEVLILVLGVLGLRISEALALTVGDLDDGMLHINKAVKNVTGHMVAEPRTKTGTERRVPMLHLQGRIEGVASSAAREPREGVRSLHPAPDTLLFPPKLGEGFLHTDTVGAIARRAARRIGVEDFKASDLRGIAETNLLAVTGDPTLVALVTGHSPAVMYTHYLRLSEAAKVSALAKMTEAFG